MLRRRPARTRRRGVALLLAAVVSALATACSPASPPAPDPTCTLPDPRPTLASGTLRLPARPAVLVLGDSYTEGYGATPTTKGWAYLIGGELGWRVTNAGVGGTGYVNPGPKNQGTYRQRLPALRGQTFDLVVLQGGSNDRDTSYVNLRDAVGGTVDAVRASFPGAPLVLLGPTSPYGRTGDVRLLSECVLANEAVGQSLPFVDPIAERWFVDGDGMRYANPDNGHPNNAGYRHFANRFEADVRVLTASS